LNFLKENTIMINILVINDDGFEAKGLHEAVKALKTIGNVTVVAPTIEKSACGHSLTLTKPLRFVELEKNFYKLDDGTPTDCVFLALNKIYTSRHRPDIVISGINEGSNMGEDITYSGTAAGAMEAVLQGIPAIAISQVCKEHCQGIEDFGFDLAKDVLVKIVKKVVEGGYPLGERKFLNINIPPIPTKECKGYKITKAGKRLYGNSAEVHFNPRGLEYFWIGRPRLDWESDEGHISDFEAIDQGYVSITPIHLDMTSHKDIVKLENWL
jgi:5'-nucleotidase